MRAVFYSATSRVTPRGWPVSSQDRRASCLAAAKTAITSTLVLIETFYPRESVATPDFPESRVSKLRAHLSAEGVFAVQDHARLGAAELGPA